MKYIVKINQKLQYNETLIGEFTNLAVVQQFVETVINHFENVSVNISIEMEEAQDD